MKVLIAGGGIGGLTAALALSQRGVEVEVLEQQSEPRELGAGIFLFANGARVLSSVGLESAVAPLRSRCAFSLCTGRRGRVLAKGKPEPYEAQFGAPLGGMHRGDLRRVLMEGALRAPNVQIQLGQRVAAIEQTPTGVTVATERGLRATGDVLIGADGIHSVVRREIAGPDAPRFSGEVVWRGLVPRERLGGAARESAARAVIWTGRDRHFLQYPVRGDELLNVGGFVESDAWRSESWTEPGRKQDFAQLFADFHPIVRDIIDAADVCFVQAIHQRDPLPAWWKGRVVLLGDACHAMPPHAGQGAGMALEDAVVLARALADQPGDLAGALAAYQAKRKDRAERVAAKVSTLGRFYNYGTPLRRAAIYSTTWLMSRLRPASRPGLWIDAYDARTA